MQDNQTDKRFPWATAIIAVALVIIAAFALIAYLKTARGIKRTVDKVISTAPEIARNFITGNITHTFRESIPQISSTQGDILELAIYRCDESFQAQRRKVGGLGLGVPGDNGRRDSGARDLPLPPAALRSLAAGGPRPGLHRPGAANSRQPAAGN